MLITPRSWSTRIVVNLENNESSAGGSAGSGSAVTDCSPLLLHQAFGGEKKTVSKRSQPWDQWCHEEPDFTCQSRKNIWGSSSTYSFHLLHFHAKHAKDVDWRDFSLISRTGSISPIWNSAGERVTLWSRDRVDTSTDSKLAHSPSQPDAVSLRQKDMKIEKY